MQVAVLVPVTHETSALRTTVDVVVGENGPRLAQVVVVVGEKTAEQSHQVAADLQARHGKLVRVVRQTEPGLGGALQTGFAACKTSHVLVMAADLETDPHLVKTLVATAEAGYDVVAATRWGQGGRFPRDQGPGQQAMDWAFQKLCQGLYATALTDLTYGFRIYRREWVCNRTWPNDKHAFLLQTLLEPLRLGAKVAQVPCAWRQRSEGEANHELWAKLACVPRALTTRFVAAASLRG